MKKIIVLLWVFFLPITSIIAQTDIEKQEVFDQLKEWAAVKLTIAYMEDLYSFTPENKGKNGTDKEYKTYKTLTNDYQDYSYEKEINLETVDQLLLKGSWRNTKKNVFDSYKTLDINAEHNFNKRQANGYTEGMAKQSFNSTIIVLNKKHEELRKVKKTIEEEQGNQKNTDEDKIENSRIETPNKSPLKETRERSLSLPFWVYIILGFFIISIIIVIILIYTNNDLRSDLKRANRDSKRTNSDQDRYDSLVIDLKGKIHRLVKDNNDLKTTNNTLNDKLKKIENPRDTKIYKSENFELTSQSIDLEIPQQKTTNLIYLSSPFQNLTFANEDARKDKTLNSLYQVDFNEQMQTGYLTILVDADLSKALNSPDTYLETACVYDNEYFNNARAIKIIEKGEIKLDGEDWIVTKKVRIKFI